MSVSKANGSHISPTKPEKHPLVELKNGKVLFRQKPLVGEKMSETMQEIVKFRDFLEQRAKETTSPLQSIPEEHVPLIAKLVHESDKTISFLVKHIQEALQPEDIREAGDDGGDDSNGASMTIPAVESAILKVADRVNYGVDWTEKISASLSVWRWEVKEQVYDLLPKAAREKFEARLAERRQAKQTLRSIFDALPQSERDALTKSGRKAKAETANVSKVTDENKPIIVSLADTEEELKSPETEEAAETKGAIGRPKKPIDPERLAKDKEKADKKAARDEKERKEKEAENKSRSLMSAFFAKPKATMTTTTSEKKGSSRPMADPSASTLRNEPSISEFEKSFKPFVVRKDATVAPINQFHLEREGKEVIVIDQEPSSGISDGTSSHGAQPQELFSEYIARVSSKTRRKPKIFEPNGPNYKSSSAYCVRDIIARLSEAEVLGDDTTVRSLDALLKSRETLPAKVLIFHEDTRPGYYGTFTRSSTVVGARTPFARDAVVFDYGYDSGEEWEVEEEGGDDLISMGGNGSDGGEESDGGSDELDGWLVDDDDEVVDPGTPLSEREGSPSAEAFSLPPPQPKRKSTAAATAGESKEPKKRKVMPLVPFSKGPCLELNIGECEYEPFNQYKIQLFNDTPFPIDPFSFISTPVIQERSAATSKQAFAVPALPAHAQAANSNTSAASLAMLPTAISDIALHSSPIATSPTTTTTATNTTTALRRTPAQPKNPFPLALLPYFADKVASLSSGNLTWLVESLFQDLRVHKVKKNAIEAKVREDCEKCPVRKVWIVKDDVLRSLGRTPVPLPSV